MCCLATQAEGTKERTHRVAERAGEEAIFAPREGAACHLLVRLRSLVGGCLSYPPLDPCALV